MDTEEESGTTFRAFLPFELQEPAAEPPPAVFDELILWSDASAQRKTVAGVANAVGVHVQQCESAGDVRDTVADEVAKERRSLVLLRSALAGAEETASGILERIRTGVDTVQLVVTDTVGSAATAHWSLPQDAMQVLPEPLTPNRIRDALLGSSREDPARREDTGRSNESFPSDVKTRGETAGASTATTTEERDFVRMRILLVEDDRINRLVNGRMVGTYGHVVVFAETGEEALRTLLDREIDLVLLDLALPDMHGTDVARAIRAGEAGPQSQAVGIIAITAYATEDERRRAESAGMDAFVSKPFSSDVLQSVIRDVVSRRMGPKGSSGRNGGENSASDEAEERRQTPNTGVGIAGEEGNDDAGMHVATILQEMREAAQKPGDFDALGSLAREYRTAAEKGGLTNEAELAFRLVLAARRHDETRVGELLEELADRAPGGP